MVHREKVYIEGVLAPSVTEVLGIVRKPFLEFWRGKLGNAKCEQVLRESQDIGTNLHSMIEAYFRGETIPEHSGPELRMFLLFKEWALRSRISPIELELSMESKIYKYHGTCDFIGKLDGKLVIVDWKTSSQMDDLHSAQLAAYAQLYLEQFNETINDGLIVRMDKKEAAKKTFEIKEYPNLSQYFPVFQNCLGVWRFLNPQKEAK
jgi:CRISPR/Cas system-associated exonuclease Cas4 (RecB family)